MHLLQKDTTLNVAHCQTPTADESCYKVGLEIFSGHFFLGNLGRQVCTCKRKYDSQNGLFCEMLFHIKPAKPVCDGKKKLKTNALVMSVAGSEGQKCRQK